jgi:hypothetical protein
MPGYILHLYVTVSGLVCCILLTLRMQTVFVLIPCSVGYTILRFEWHDFVCMTDAVVYVKYTYSCSYLQACFNRRSTRFFLMGLTRFFFCLYKDNVFHLVQFFCTLYDKVVPYAIVLLQRRLVGWIIKRNHADQISLLCRFVLELDRKVFATC